MSRSSEIARGGAATVISPEGDIKLVFKLDKSWVSDIDRFTPFNPNNSDIKLSINLIVDGVTTTYSIDHQTWPTTYSHNGQIHSFDETSPIRLASIHVDGDSLDLEERDPEEDVVGVVWKAKHLIGKQWEEDELGTLNQKGNSRRSALGGSNSASIADIRRKVTTKFRHADRLVTRQIKPQKRQRSYSDEEDRSTGSDSCMSDVSDEALPSIKSLFGSSEGEPDRPGRAVSIPRPMPPPEVHQVSREPSNDRRKVYVDYPDGPLILSVKSPTKGWKIHEAVARSKGVPGGSFRLILSSSNERLGWDQTVHEMGLKEFGDTADIETDTMFVDIIMEQIGGKPVIYLYPPHPMSVDVTLSLCQQWAISAVHPPTPILKPDSTKADNGLERVKWTVNAEVDGTMVDKATGLEVSYLFWEAETCGGGAKEIRNHESTGEITSFEPCYTRLSPDQSNNIILPSSEVSMYLDKALKVLGLHTEARTSFITYWLPHYQRHPYIALTFLPQDMYSKAAPLDISPRPDIVTRVFMLFQKVDLDQLDNWADAVSTTKEDVRFWRDVVGVESKDQQEDGSLFRVLEWGGMEII